MMGRMNISNNITAEKTLFDVLRDLWRGRVYMAVFAVIMLVVAFIFMFFAKDFYQAEMILAPASHMGGNLSVSSEVGEGSISAMRGDLQSTPAFLRFENIYNGAQVAAILLNDKEVISALKFDRNFEFSAPKTGWNAAKLSEYLKRRVKLEPVSGTSLRRLIYLHPNKEFAFYMISRIYNASDEIIRRSTLEQVNGRIVYLKKALVATTNSEHRRNFTALLMEQERIKMLVSIDQPYAASIIEPAHILSKPSWPDPYVIYPMFLFVGLLLGFIVHGLRHNE